MANFTFIRRKAEHRCLENQTYGNLTYQTDFNADDVKAYREKVAFYDRKLSLPDEPIDYYYCDNFVEAQKTLFNQT